MYAFSMRRAILHTRTIWNVFLVQAGATQKEQRGESGGAQ